MIHNLDNLRNEAYANACNHGFHNEILSNEHWFCLVVSELMEAVEADRKGMHADKEGFMLNIEAYDRSSYKYLTQEVVFKRLFKEYIKDSVEDELADAAIRLLDLAGLRDITIDNFSDDDIEDASESCNDETFTESIYAISTIPIRHEYEYNDKLDKQLNSMLISIIGLAKHLNIDIMWHIEQKIKYNKLRSYKHGKQY